MTEQYAGILKVIEMRARALRSRQAMLGHKTIEKKQRLKDVRTSLSTLDDTAAYLAEHLNMAERKNGFVLSNRIAAITAQHANEVKAHGEQIMELGMELTEILRETTSIQHDLSALERRRIKLEKVENAMDRAARRERMLRREAAQGDMHAARTSGLAGKR